jgi:hypothetical protein
VFAQDDLGTARRERLSTEDDPRNIVRVDHIALEAARGSNIPGTEAFKLANQNRSALAGWGSKLLFIDPFLIQLTLTSQTYERKLRLPRQVEKNYKTLEVASPTVPVSMLVLQKPKLSKMSAGKNLTNVPVVTLDQIFKFLLIIGVSSPCPP